ncbi:MAG: electron transport complex subunit RsxD [Gammaproteobacteria bacterium]|nr:electron transport complex subunit RsxD [Gammaproteobacteria bacterium]
MEFRKSSAPFLAPQTSVSQVMLHVIVALVPATVAHIWYFGWGIVIQMWLAIATAYAAEAAMLALRDKPLRPFLTDFSAPVTAILLAFCVPPTSPWWLVVIGTAFAIVFAKHLYGGLGFNPFNPAMVGYVVLLISFPTQMTNWLAPEMLVDQEFRITLWQTISTIFAGTYPSGVNVDAVTSATPLDVMRASLADNRTVMEIRNNPMFGDFGGRGWEWIGNYIVLGGIWLLYKRVIRWQIPVGVLAGLGITAFVFYALDPSSHASPGFHVFSGGALLCAFFIATDPVSAATTERGRLYYGIGIGVLIYVIRTWGGYPDGVAFAVLLANLCAPLIDHYTRPRVYGHAGK